MEASLLGYAAQRVTGIVIKAGKTNKVDFQLSDDAILLDIGVEIKAYKVPLIDVDNTTQGSTVTAEQIRALPTKTLMPLLQPLPVWHPRTEVTSMSEVRDQMKLSILLMVSVSRVI